MGSHPTLIQLQTLVDTHSLDQQVERAMESGVGAAGIEADTTHTVLIPTKVDTVAFQLSKGRLCQIQSSILEFLAKGRQ